MSEQEKFARLGDLATRRITSEQEDFYLQWLENFALDYIKAERPNIKNVSVKRFFEIATEKKHPLYAMSTPVLQEVKKKPLEKGDLYACATDGMRLHFSDSPEVVEKYQFPDLNERFPKVDDIIREGEIRRRSHEIKTSWIPGIDDENTVHWFFRVSFADKELFFNAQFVTDALGACRKNDSHKIEIVKLGSSQEVLFIEIIRQNGPILNAVIMPLAIGEKTRLLR